MADGFRQFVKWTNVIMGFAQIISGIIDLVYFEFITFGAVIMPIYLM